MKPTVLGTRFLIVSSRPPCAPGLLLSRRIAGWLGALAFAGAGPVHALELPTPGDWDTQVIPENQQKHVATDGSIVATSLGGRVGWFECDFRPFWRYR
jgi:hypothetical protein